MTNSHWQHFENMCGDKEWRRQATPGDDPLFSLLDRVAEDYVNGTQDADSFIGAVDRCIERYRPRFRAES